MKKLELYKKNILIWILMFVISLIILAFGIFWYQGDVTVNVKDTKGGEVIARMPNKYTVNIDDSCYFYLTPLNKLPELEVKPFEGYTLSSFTVTSADNKEVEISSYLKDNKIASSSRRELKNLFKDISLPKDLKFNVSFKAKEEPKVNEFKVTLIGENISEIEVYDDNSNFTLTDEGNTTYSFIAKEGTTYVGSVKVILLTVTQNFLGWFNEDKITPVSYATDQGGLVLKFNNTFSSNVTLYAIGEAS